MARLEHPIQSGLGAAGVMGKMLGMQITGGSSTAPDAFDRLRVAGAVAHQMLLGGGIQRFDGKKRRRPPRAC